MFAKKEKVVKILYLFSMLFITLCYFIFYSMSKEGIDVNKGYLIAIYKLILLMILLIPGNYLLF